MSELGNAVGLWWGERIIRSRFVTGPATVGESPDCTIIAPCEGRGATALCDGDQLWIPEGFERVGEPVPHSADPYPLRENDEVVLRCVAYPTIRITVVRHRRSDSDVAPVRPLRRSPEALVVVTLLALWGLGTSLMPSSASAIETIEVDSSPLVEAMFAAAPAPVAAVPLAPRHATQASRGTPTSPTPADAVGQPPTPTAVDTTVEVTPDGEFTLDEAFVGDDVLLDRSQGALLAVMETSHGTIQCTLEEKRAPRAVANFVGLARGTRPFMDPDSEQWTRGRLYDGLTFHRVVDRFVIQGGDPTGTGRGGPGYEFADEIDPELRFDRPGRLAMANKGPGTNGSQFFITLGTHPHLDGKHTIFGQCDLEAARRIAKVPVDPRRSHRPQAPVTIVRIAVGRGPASGS